MNAFLEQIALLAAGEPTVTAAESTWSPDYGSDISCTDDTDAFFTGLAGDDPRLVAEYAYRAITSPRGSIPGAPDEGMSIREFLRRPATPTEMRTWPSRVKAEILRDDRVESVDVVFTPQTTGVYKVSISGKTATGPFGLTAVLTPTGTVLKEILA